MQTAANTDRALFTHASMGIVVINSKGIMLSVNPFALKLFDYTLEELIGKPIEVLIPQRYHHKHVHHRDDYINHPKSRPMGVGMDLFAVKKDGTEFPVEVSLGNYQNNGEEFAIAFISNISVRKKAEAEIVKLNDELEATVEQRTRELTDTLHELERSKEELSKLLSKEKELGDLKSRAIVEVKKLTGNKGVDTVIEAVGIPATFELCQSLVAPGGTIANIGVHGKSVVLHLETLWAQNITITTRLVDTVTTPMLLKTIQSKKLDSTKLITHCYKLNEIIKAYDTFENAAKEKALKVILSNE